MQNVTLNSADIFERLKKSLNIRNDTELALELGEAPNKLSVWKSRNTIPFEVLLSFCRKKGLQFEWVLTGEIDEWRDIGPPRLASKSKGIEIQDESSKYDKLPDDYIQVPRYELAASAGGGSAVHSEQVVDYLTFKKDWLKTQLGLSPAYVAVISVAGDSMEPYLFDGDLIMVDTNVTRIENDSVYVLQVDGSLLVKRIQKKLDGTVIVKSDNERYEPDVFRGEAAAQLRVVGRLVKRLVR